MVAALIADGFLNYLRAGHRKPAEELLVERANMLTSSQPQDSTPRRVFRNRATEERLRQDTQEDSA
jgi:hypothetical protein